MKKVAIIGAGAVGHFYANRLNDAGYSIDLVVSRSSDSAISLANRFNAQVATWDDLSILDDISVLVLSVPDDAISKVVDLLKNKWRPHTEAIAFHCSGLVTRSVLKPLEYENSIFCAIHPLRSIVSNQSIDLAERIICGVEVEKDQQSSVEEFLMDLNLDAVWLSEKSKGKYHLVASIISNFTVSIHSALEELCEDMREEGSNIELAHFGDLLLGTLNNVETMGSKDALTGPILRGDLGTVKEHLQILDENYPNLLSVYKQLANLTLGLALTRNTISDDRRKQLEALFAE